MTSETELGLYRSSNGKDRENDRQTTYVAVITSGKQQSIIMKDCPIKLGSEVGKILAVESFSLNRENDTFIIKGKNGSVELECFWGCNGKKDEHVPGSKKMTKAQENELLFWTSFMREAKPGGDSLTAVKKLLQY
jgi:hypothetical protein